MSYKNISLMDSGYFFCPYVPLSETPVVFQDLSGQDRTDRYEESNRLHQEFEILRRREVENTAFNKYNEQIVNWRQDGS